MRMRAPLTATSQRPPPCLALAGRVARPWLGLALRCGPLQAPVRSQRTRTRAFHPHPHHTTNTPTTRTRSSRAGTFVSRPACARAARRPPPTAGRRACGGRRGAFPERAAGPTNALARNRARRRARARAGARARTQPFTHARVPCRRFCTPCTHIRLVPPAHACMARVQPAACSERLGDGPRSIAPHRAAFPPPGWAWLGWGTTVSWIPFFIRISFT